MALEGQGGQSTASYLGSAADWPPPTACFPRKPKVAQFCAAPWPNFTPALTALTGRIEVRFADSTLITQAIDGSPCELEFAWSLGANASFTFTAHAVYLPIPRIEIAGPKGVQASFDWQAAKATSPARMCTATLINTLAGY